jgi:hypothetical protein
MTKFSFDVGDRVRFVSTYPGTPQAVFVVVSRHGEEDGQPGYRLRNDLDGAQRYGLQKELEAVGPVQTVIE